MSGITKRNHDHLVAGWLQDLGGLCSGNQPMADLKARIATMTGVVSDAFPEDATFTRASLTHVAGKCGVFYPSFSELQRYLGDWWGANRPREFVMPPELSGAKMSPEDRANVFVWLKHDAANDLPDEDMVLRLSVIRRYANTGYRWLVNYSQRAALIAVSRRWDPPSRDAPPTEDEMSEVQRTVLRASLATAPVHQPYQNPTAQKQAAFEARTGRKPGTLSAEDLARARDQNPGVQASRELQEQERRRIASGIMPWNDAP